MIQRVFVLRFLIEGFIKGCFKVLLKGVLMSFMGFMGCLKMLRCCFKGLKGLLKGFGRLSRVFQGFGSAVFARGARVMFGFIGKCGGLFCAQNSRDSSTLFEKTDTKNVFQVKCTQ